MEAAVKIVSVEVASVEASAEAFFGAFVKLHSWKL